MSIILNKENGNIAVQPFFNEKERKFVAGIEYWCCNCGKNKVTSDNEETGKFLFLGGYTYVKERKTFVEQDSYIMTAICKSCIIATCNAGYLPYKEGG